MKQCPNYGAEVQIKWTFCPGCCTCRFDHPEAEFSAGIVGLDHSHESEGRNCDDSDMAYLYSAIVAAAFVAIEQLHQITLSEETQ